MQTKLTLRLDRRLIQRAKAYARSTGKSVSEIVADFFSRIDTGAVESRDVSPPVRSLLGALRAGRVREEDYRRYLVRKHK